MREKYLRKLGSLTGTKNGDSIDWVDDPGIDPLHISIMLFGLHRNCHTLNRFPGCRYRFITKRMIGVNNSAIHALPIGWNYRIAYTLPDLPVDSVRYSQ